MRNLLAAVVLLALVGCAAPMRTYTGPATADALDCALARATAAGFYPLEGGKSDGFIKLARKADTSAGRVAARIATLGMVGGDDAEMDHLTLTDAGGTLRVQVVGINDNDTVKPTPQGDEHARAILAACSAS